MASIVPLAPLNKSRAMRPLGRILLILPLLMTAGSRADDERFQARVRLFVTCKDCMEGSVRSYLSRQLRTVPDVVITDEIPDFEIRVIVMKTTNVQGIETGWAMGVVVLDSSVGRNAAFGIDQGTKSCPATARKNLSTALHGHPMSVEALVALSHFTIHTLAPADLERECKEIIAQFDGDVLEPARASHQSLQEFLRKSRR